MQACVVVASACWMNSATAIDANVPITNTALVRYETGGSQLELSSAATIITDPQAGNSPPTGLVETQFFVPENSPGGVLGLLEVIDSDSGDVHSVTITDSRFSLSGLELSLAPTVSLDFETQSAIQLAVTIVDAAGASVTTDVLIGVTDLNEAPFDLVLDSSAVAADTPGALVGTVAVSDPDAGDSHVFTVDDPRFEVVGSELRLLAGEQLAAGEEAAIVITATDSGGLSVDLPVVIRGAANPVGGPVTIELLSTDLAFGESIQVGASLCSTTGAAGGQLSNIDAIVSFAGTSLDLPLSTSVSVAPLYNAGEAVFFRVFDVTANTDPSIADTLFVELSSASGDQEFISARETGLDTGEFVGVVSSQSQANVTGDCALALQPNDTVSASYTQVGANGAEVTTQALVDPLSRVFESANGVPVSQTQLVLIDVATGAPANVFANDGVTAFPATVTSGGTIFDAAGTQYDFAPGQYRFPYLQPGTYRLELVPPNRFLFPSAQADAALQALPGAPYQLLAGSRGQEFSVARAGPFVIDVPLDLAPVEPTPATITALRVQLSQPAGLTIDVTPSVCVVGADDQVLSPPLAGDGSAVSLNGLGLDETAQFTAGEALFVRVEDPDQDLDPFIADRIEVMITSDAGDQETIGLAETAPSSGVFVGYLPSATGGSVVGDCQLNAAPGLGVRFGYDDPDDGTDQVSATAVLDPRGLVFRSSDGSSVDGARVVLIDVATGLPATVFERDGTTPHPAELVSGAPAAGTDSLGAGEFLFPFVPAGRYRIEVTPPRGLGFPSSATDTDLATFFSGPFVRGAEFELENAGVVGGLVPLDVVSTEVFVEKTASRASVAVGDVLQYQIRVENPTPTVLSQLVLVDRLPSGFRLAEGSVRIDGEAVADPAISADGRTLDFPLSELPPASVLTLSYVAEVTPGAGLGQAINRAQLVGPGVANTSPAEAVVEVIDDLLRSQGIIVGEVRIGACDQPGVPLPGVRLLLEDGRFVVTDEFGRYHVEGLDPGAHVVQLDTATLPADYSALACNKSNRFAGSAISQFVDVTRGGLWRADFRVDADIVSGGEVRARLLSSFRDGVARYRYQISSEAATAVQQMHTTVILDAGLTYVQGSGRVAGVAVEPKQFDGALSFAVPDQTGAFNLEVEFSAESTDSSLRYETKATTVFRSATAAHRLAVVGAVTNLKAPTSLEKTFEENGIVWRDGRTSAPVGGPSTGAFVAASDTAVVQLSDSGPKPILPANATPDFLAEVKVEGAPDYDQQWLAGQTAEAEIVWPLEDMNPRIPAIEVAVKHAVGQRPNLLVNGVLVDSLSFEKVVVNHARKNAVSYWKNVVIKSGENELVAQIESKEGELVASARRAVWLSEAPVTAQLDLDESTLIADGITPAVIAVRLFDRNGRPARAGLTGEFNLAPPYSAFDANRSLSQLSENSRQGSQRYVVRENGIAYIALAPTSLGGEAVLRFDFDRHRQKELRARLKPVVRDWVLVGLAEGTASLDTLAPHLEPLDGDQASGLQTDGRLAFYAKGQIRGDWLLTLSYDNDRSNDLTFRQQIDPNNFYTLYGDGGEQDFDAETSRQLFVRLERDTFQALVGDFDTELDTTELTRYSRRLNGIKAQYYNGGVTGTAFAANTDQGFARETLPGDGTSGIYRLSQGAIVRNSERISLVVRDRFSTDQALETTVLTRFIDYSIDYAAGTLLFRNPVLSQDRNFNPQFIEVEYEVDGRQEELVTGARVAYAPIEQDRDKLEVGVTYVRDESIGEGGDLVGADLDMALSANNRLRLEAAATDTEESGKGNAFLAELRHQGERLAGRLFYRQQDGEFGLGQQTVLDNGLRRIGLEGDWRITDRLLLRGEAQHADDLINGGERDLATVEVQFNHRSNQLTAGVRALREQTAAGDEIRTEQLLVGASREFFDSRLLVRSDAEFSFSGGPGDSADFPSRAIAGLEYRLRRGFSVFAEQELTFGGLRDTQDTRVGFSGQPWVGGEVRTSIDREFSENGERVFATSGLLQQWRFGERWLFDAGLDRVNTLRRSGTQDDEVSFAPFLPPASGSFVGGDGVQLNQDFTALFAGVGYRYQQWDLSSRFEVHRGDLADRLNFLVGASHQLSDGKIFSLSASVLDERGSEGVDRFTTQARAGMAWRPLDSRWTLLSRLDLSFEDLEGGLFDTSTRKLVHNLNLNYASNEHLEWTLQTGLKYQRNRIDDARFDGLTGLVGIAGRYDINARWAVGAHANTLVSGTSDVGTYSYGLSVSRSILKNTWVRLGYNFAGLDDDDFVAADYSQQGPYFQFRLKVDQESFKRFIARLPGIGGRSDRLAGDR